MTLILSLQFLACGKGDDSAGLSDSDADADSDTDTDADSDADSDTDSDADSDTDTDADSPEIAGSYTDSWGGTHVITATEWDMGFALFHIGPVDNDQNVLVAQNDKANKYSPGLWSRFDWTYDGADLWFCQTVYDGATMKDAWSATAADSTDPAKSGCSGFSWTQLIPD